jgi:uncharacterized membrane protein HdeD (DUF308 family)
MTTSHTTPTPPLPRPGGDEGPQTPRGRHAQESEQERQQPAGFEEVPGGLGSVMAQWGLRPWKALYVAAAVTFIFGLIVLVWPGATLVVLAVLFGCYLLISGVLSLIEGLSGHDADGFTRAVYIVVGVLGVVLGLFCLRRIDVSVLVLAFLLSVFWIMRGIFDLSVAISRRDGYSNGWRAFTGVVSLIAGILVLVWPGITLYTLLVFAGAWLMVYGLMLGFLGYRLHRLAKEAGEADRTVSPTPTVSPTMG